MPFAAQTVIICCALHNFCKHTGNVYSKDIGDEKDIVVLET